MDTLEVAPNIFRIQDTCNVYLLRDGRRAIAIDFGSGLVLDSLDGLGVDEVTDVLMTHHHRDQGQGLTRAVEMGIRIWVPPVERGLFDAINEHWQVRRLDNDYEPTQDKFSILESVNIEGVAVEYERQTYGSWEVLTLPTPGHTVGSVSYVVEVAGRCVVFVGDLVYCPSKVWSLASMQWTLNGLEGAGMTIASLRSLRSVVPDLLLPSHGAPIDQPSRAIEQVTERLQELLEHRPTTKASHIESRDLVKWTEHPYERISEHLVMNRTSQAISYALLSGDGVALMFDYGYDMTGGVPTPTGRYARRPWLASLPALHRDFGISRVEVVMPTHYHDDHVAGFNLLRENQGTEVWAAENIAPVISDPKRFDLPALWHDAIEVDRILPLRQPIAWHEYELTLYDLGGHTLYAVATVFEVDGQRVIVTGDQQDGAWRSGEQLEYLNYQYRSRFRVDDYIKSAKLYREVAPHLMVSGHWRPRVITDDYLDALLEEGECVARLHRELLPLDEVDFGAEGFGARIEPYRSKVEGGKPVTVTVTLLNPFACPAEVAGAMVVPDDWKCSPPSGHRVAEAHGIVILEFVICPPLVEVRRARIAVDMSVNGTRFGQQAEALIDVTTSEL